MNIEHLHTACAIFLFIRFISVLTNTNQTIETNRKVLEKLLELNAAENRMWLKSNHPLQSVIMYTADCTECDLKTRSKIRNLKRNTWIHSILISAAYLISTILLWYK